MSQFLASVGRTASASQSAALYSAKLGTVESRDQMAANILAAAGLELNHCNKHVNAQDRLAVIASPALAGHSSVAPEATEHESEQLLGYRFSVVDRGADTLASKQHPVPPTRHVTIRNLQGTNTTGPRHLTKSRVKRISKHRIQSKCCFMTAVMQTEGLPTLSRKVSTVGRHESRLTLNYTLSFTIMLKPTIWSTKSTITKLLCDPLL